MVLRYDLQVNVFGHAADKTVGPAQSRAAAEHQTKRLHISGVDRRKRRYDIPVLFDEDRAWQFKLPLNFEQILERRFIAQRPAPDCRPGVGARISPLPAQPIEWDLC